MPSHPCPHYLKLSTVHKPFLTKLHVFLNFQLHFLPFPLYGTECESWEKKSRHSLNGDLFKNVLYQQTGPSLSLSLASLEVLGHRQNTTGFLIRMPQEWLPSETTRAQAPLCTDNSCLSSSHQNGLQYATDFLTRSSKLLHIATTS